MPTNEYLQIPLAQIRPNPDQPRQVQDQEDIHLMAASLTAIGQQTAAKVRPLTPEERTNSGEAAYELIGGHSRYFGALLAGLTTLKCEVLDLTPEEAELAAFMDNQYNEMSWIDTDLRIARIAKRQSGLPQKAIAAKLKVSERKLFTALKIDKALTPGSVSLIRENIQKSLISEPGTPRLKNKAFLITEHMVEFLAALPDPLEVEKALKVVWDNLMPEAEVRKLVAHIQAGNSPDLYETAKPTPKEQSPKHAVSSPTANATQPVQAEKTPAHIHPVKTASNQVQMPKPTSPAQISEGAPSSSKGTGATKPLSSPDGDRPAGSLSEGEQVLWEAATGISVSTQIKAKIKKGQRPSIWEVFLLAGYQLWRALAWLNKNAFKLIGHLLKWVWKLFLDALKSTAQLFGKAVYRVARLVLIIGLLLGVVWLVCAIFMPGVLHPVEQVWNKFHKPSIVSTPAPQPVVSVPTAVPTQQFTQQPVSIVEAKPTDVPTPKVMAHHGNKAVATKAEPTAIPTVVPTQVVQINTTPKPQGDIISQAADGAVKGANAVDAVKHLLPF